jgi:hypothetical protein
MFSGVFPKSLSYQLYIEMVKSAFKTGACYVADTIIRFNQADQLSNLALLGVLQDLKKNSSKMFVRKT